VPDGVTLTLTDEEARTLREIFYKVGGSPFRSRRGHVDAINSALSEAGVENPAARYASRSTAGERSSSEGNIRFADLPEGDPAREGLRPDPFADVVDDDDLFA